MLGRVGRGRTRSAVFVGACIALLGAGGCGRETPPAPARRAPAPPAARTGDESPPAPRPTPLLRHGEHLHVFHEPLPGKGLRLLFGGPPYRLCEVADLAGDAGPKARCADPQLATGAEHAEIVSLEEGTSTHLRAGPTLPTGPILDARGTVRFALTAQDVHVASGGPISGLEATNERGWELLRFREAAPPDRLRLPSARESMPTLFGDLGLYHQGGRLKARRVLRAERPFGPVEDLGPAPPWSSRTACRSAAGTAVALLAPDLWRSVPNAGRVDEPGPAIFLFDGAEGLRAVTTTLPARPPGLACDGSSASVVWVRTDRRRREGRRRHDVTQVRCTAAGCATSTTTLTGFAAWNPPAVDLGGAVLLVWADGRDVHMRIAPIDALGAAPDRVIYSGPEPPASMELHPRGSHAALLVDFRDHAVLLRVARDGSVVAIPPETDLPPLADGIPRFGAGG